jgi:hypothetical protein
VGLLGERRGVHKEAVRQQPEGQLAEEEYNSGDALLRGEQQGFLLGDSIFYFSSD